MKINFPQTKAKFEGMGLSQKKIARIHGHSFAVFHQVLNGIYPSLQSSRAQACIATLRDLGVLVEDQDKAA